MEAYKISESEWKVMEILWNNDVVTLSQIVEELDDMEWSYSTIKTLLKRLVNKKCVDVDKSVGNSFRYQAAIKQDQCQVAETEEFLDRVFGGSVSMLMSALSKNNKISKSEKEELLDIINKIDD